MFKGSHVTMSTQYYDLAINSATENFTRKESIIATRL